MKDFAASAMMRLVRLGLQRAGIDLATLRPPTAAGAWVPLSDKRHLLDLLMQSHGPLLLLKLGEAVDDAADEPTLAALTEARSPLELIQRWQRLERFVHSRHRVLTLSSTGSGCTLRHVSLKEGEAPTAPEDLLVLGLLMGLLRRIGTLDLRARFSGDVPWRQAGDGWRLDLWPCDTAAWEIAWRPPLSPQAPPPMPAAAATPEAARALLAADCAAAWTLARLAASMGLAPRTLQRRLQDAGTSFSSLWTEVRLAKAARQLMAGQDAVAQVGYLCGFADQAHFTRSFRRHTAMTPTVYRGQFSASSSNLQSRQTLRP